MRDAISERRNNNYSHRKPAFGDSEETLQKASNPCVFQKRFILCPEKRRDFHVYLSHYQSIVYTYFVHKCGFLARQKGCFYKLKVTLSARKKPKNDSKNMISDHIKSFSQTSHPIFLALPVVCRGQMKGKKKPFYSE